MVTGFIDVLYQMICVIIWLILHTQKAPAV